MSGKSIAETQKPARLHMRAGQFLLYMQFVLYTFSARMTRKTARPPQLSAEDMQHSRNRGRLNGAGRISVCAAFQDISHTGLAAQLQKRMRIRSYTG